MQLRQCRLKSSAWERLRCIHMEKTGSNRSNIGEEGSRAESNRGPSGKQKKSEPKSKSREALESTQSQRFDVINGAGNAARRATLQLIAQSREGQLSLFSMSMTTRGNFGQNLAKPSISYPRLYGRLLTSRFRRPIKETGGRSWWSRVWYCEIVESLGSS